MATRARLAAWLRGSVRWLLLALWLAALIDVLAPGLGMATAAWPALALFLGLALLRTRPATRLLCLVLAGGAGVLAAAFGVAEAIPHGLERGLLFAAFMPSLVLLRATAEQRHETAEARAVFAGLPPAQRAGGMMVGGHLLGAALNIGILAILAPVIGRGGPEAERRRVVTATLRGFILAVLWSPFSVGMGLVTSYLPAVPFWQIVLLGGALAVLGLAVSFALFDRAAGARALLQAAASLMPVVPAVIVATLAVALVGAALSLPTLAALIVTLPVLCALALATEAGARPRFAVAATLEGLGGVGGEVAVLSLALVLGTVLDAVMATGAVRLPPPGAVPAIALLAGATATIVAAAALAVHPIVSATVVLVFLTSMPQPVHGLSLLMAVLMGWSLGSMVSISGIAIATASALFAIPPERIIRGANAIFVACFGAVAILVLAALDAVLRG